MEFENPAKMRSLSKFFGSPICNSFKKFSKDIIIVLVITLNIVCCYLLNPSLNRYSFYKINLLEVFIKFEVFLLLYPIFVEISYTCRCLKLIEQVFVCYTGNTRNLMSSSKLTAWLINSSSLVVFATIDYYDYFAFFLL